MLDDVTMEALGIWLEESETAALRVDCIPLARRIKTSGRRIVALLPASPDIGVMAVGMQLGLALVESSNTTAAYVDANVRWPGISEIAVGSRPDDDESLFATRWLRGQLAVLTPQRAAEAGAGVPQLARVIQHSTEIFSHVVVDLTGFKTLGEHLAAFEMVDGVIIVARAGRTTDDELLRLNHEVPRVLNMGVLLSHAELPAPATLRRE
ncbi:MAG TPA: hypothetical protein VHB97_23525 [Polyangia bacterium]|nr:hypothetical protein [Polyangia bacterium]